MKLRIRRETEISNGVKVSKWYVEKKGWFFWYGMKHYVPHTFGGGVWLYSHDSLESAEQFLKLKMDTYVKRINDSVTSSKVLKIVEYDADRGALITRE